MSHPSNIVHLHSRYLRGVAYGGRGGWSHLQPSTGIPVQSPQVMMLVSRQPVGVHVILSRGAAAQGGRGRGQLGGRGPVNLQGPLEGGGEGGGREREGGGV